MRPSPAIPMAAAPEIFAKGDAASSQGGYSIDLCQISFFDQTWIGRQLDYDAIVGELETKCRQVGLDLTGEHGPRTKSLDGDSLHRSLSLLVVSSRCRLAHPPLLRRRQRTSQRFVVDGSVCRRILRVREAHRCDSARVVRGALAGAVRSKRKRRTTSTDQLRSRCPSPCWTHRRLRRQPTPQRVDVNAATAEALPKLGPSEEDRC